MATPCQDFAPLPNLCDVPDDSDEQMQRELEFLGFLTPDQRLCLPDWMVIGPPKTGTSWIYANLGAHPQAYVPPIKELKYFSNRFETEDLRSCPTSGVESAKRRGRPRPVTASFPGARSA